MKTNYLVNNRVRTMKAQDIPKNKREDYTRYLTGFCNSIGGYTRAVENAIDHIQEQDLKGEEAMDYIETQILEKDGRFEQVAIENMADDFF